jgi:hypothetical protein
MLKHSTKCWISAFYAQGSRGIIVAIQVGEVKIYVTAVEELRKKKKDTVKLRKTSKSLVSPLSFVANVLFCMSFFNLTLCMTKLRVLVLSFSWLYGNLYCITKTIAPTIVKYIANSSKTLGVNQHSHLKSWTQENEPSYKCSIPWPFFNVTNIHF